VGKTIRNVWPQDNMNTVHVYEMGATLPFRG